MYGENKSSVHFEVLGVFGFIICWSCEMPIFLSWCYCFDHPSSRRWLPAWRLLARMGDFSFLWSVPRAGPAAVGWGSCRSSTNLRAYWERRAGAQWAALTALRASPDCVCLCGLLLELSRHKQNLGSDNVRFASLFVLSCVTCCPSTGGNLKNLPCVFVSRALVDLWDPTQLGGGLLKHFIFPGLVRCYF